MNGIIEDLLKEYTNKEISLEETDICQELAIEKFKKGENILLVSAAGCGKSFCIKKMKDMTKKNMYLTATTGVAAYTIGGMTINSFLGIGTGTLSAQDLYRKIIRSKILVDRIKSTDILVIDEISMMSASLFEKINYIFMAVKRDPKFFGGVQVIFSGDFMQAMPIFKNVDDTRLIFESELIEENFNIIKLNKNHRQYDDFKFKNLLNRLRLGKINSDDIQDINNRKIQCNLQKQPIFLTSTNKKASMINKISMDKIIEPCKMYKMKLSGNKDMQKELEYQMTIKGMNTLYLKKSARVMLVKNIDTEIGLVNGAMGIIKEINGRYPEIKFDNGVIKVIQEEEWSLEVNDLKATVKQLPLMISYACTIWKSQSLTLKNAILDLEDVFAEHIIYVALSRISSLDGVYIDSFNPNKIKVSKKCLDFTE